jgi:pyridoxine kinase
MMLSGYLPGAASVEALGTIARDLKYKATMEPGNFFWVLDPVMGDNGKLYVAEDVPPAYKSLIRDADLVLPNQFEAEYSSFFGNSWVHGTDAGEGHYQESRLWIWKR